MSRGQRVPGNLLREPGESVGFAVRGLHKDVVAGKGAAQDQALVAAQCALALRAEFAGAPMSLVTGSGEVSGGQWVGEVLERAASLVGDASYGLRLGASGTHATVGCCASSCSTRRR